MGDLGFKGQLYTWVNNRSGQDRIVERLDRAMANEAWKKDHPRAQCIHGLVIGSDHAPIHVRFDCADQRGVKNFKIEDMWFENPECMEVISRAWSRGDPWVRLRISTPNWLLAA